MEMISIVWRGRLVFLRLGVVDGVWRAFSAEWAVDVSGPSREAVLAAAREALEGMISASGLPPMPT